jgi:hypothetical protein
MNNITRRTFVAAIPAVGVAVGSGKLSAARSSRRRRDVQRRSRQKASASGIRSVTAERNGEMPEITADYYISALPVEIMTRLVDDSLKALAPSLATLDKLRTEWMNGISISRRMLR